MEHYMAIRNITTAVWYILWPFGNLVAIWYISPRFGTLDKEKSGNPALLSSLRAHMYVQPISLSICKSTKDETKLVCLSIFFLSFYISFSLHLSVFFHFRVTRLGEF
jgi:hypothetical protein